jgi:hypothetical protein
MKQFIKLNSRGFVHHLAIMLVIVGAVAAFGAYKVMYSSADTNAYTVRKPNGCWPGERNNNGCKPINDVSTRLADCAEYKIQPQGDRCVSQCGNGSCFVNCIGGWHVSAQTGKCEVNSGPNGGDTGNSGGSGGDTGNSNDKTEADCDRLNRRFNSSNRQCGECKNGFQNQPGQDRGACIPVPAPSPGNTNQQGSGTSNDKTKADCDNLNRTFNSSNKQCGSCKNNFYNADGTDHGKCQPRPVSDAVVPPMPTQSGTQQQTKDNDKGNKGNEGKNYTVAFSSNNNVQNVQLRCTSRHLVYNEKANTCGTQCVDGYQKVIGGSCAYGDTSCQGMIAGDGTCVGKNKIEEYCKNFKFVYNKNRNACENKCIDKYSMVDGACAKNGTDPVTDPPVLNLDVAINKKTCEALGRQWESGTVDANGSKIKGCSANLCDKNKATVIANAEGGRPYCSGYIAKISELDCRNLHRVWMNEVAGCRQNPKQKDNGARLSKAPECLENYSTYVFQKGEDKCVDPSVVDQVAGLAHNGTKPFTGAANLTQAQLCNLQPKKHWNGKKCVADKPASTSGGNQETGSSSSSSNSNSSSSTASSSSSTTVRPSQSECSALGRKWLGNKCAKHNGSLSAGKASAYCVNAQAAYLSTTPYDRCMADAASSSSSSTSTSSTPTPTPSSSPGATAQNPIGTSCDFLHAISATNYACQGKDRFTGAATCPAFMSGPGIKVAFSPVFRKYYSAVTCYK